jgi:spoIIIJ-associated protein
MGTQAPQPGQSDAGPIENDLRRIEAVLKLMIQAGGFALDVSVGKAPPDPLSPEAAEWIVNFSGADSDLLLESHAALLDALASVACKASRLDESLHRRISFDCRDYRRMRATELRLMAQMAAERVIESGEPFEMSPMNSAERRLVHLAVKEQPKVRSESQGFGPERRVVIHPALGD